MQDALIHELIRMPLHLKTIALFGVPDLPGLGIRAWNDSWSSHVPVRTVMTSVILVAYYHTLQVKGMTKEIRHIEMAILSQGAMVYGQANRVEQPDIRNVQ